VKTNDSFYQALRSELKQTRFYQEAREEGRQEGLQEARQKAFEQGKLQAKLAMVPWLLQKGFSIEGLAELLELDVATIRQVAVEQIMIQEYLFSFL